ncbi:MAG: hypothetical protein R3B70_06165 [Polyangiaceae bacterium]
MTRFAVVPVVAWVTPLRARAEPGGGGARLLGAVRDVPRRGLVRAIPFEAVRRLVRSYPVDGEVVWGATATILSDLARLVRVR